MRMPTLLTIPIDTVTRLTPESAVFVLRALLRAEAAYAKLKPDALTISQEITMSDGGIDAEVDCDVTTPDDCFFAGGLTGYQIKSGASFKPWTKSSIENELLNNRKELFPEVARLIERGGNYLVLSTGHDLTPQQRNKGRAQIKEVFERCGFPNYRGAVDVLGASQIADYAARYPGVAAMLGVDPIQDAWVYQQWQQDAHMGNEFKAAPEQAALIQRIQDSLRENTKHIRILGEPGLGKTRLVLEALRGSEFAACVLYVREGMSFGQSALFRELIKRAKHDKPLIVVLDDLSELEMVEIWRHLKNRCGFLKLISLDHGHDSSHDEEILRLQAPQLPNETIKAILVDRAGESRELDRWVDICEGSPRVAQAVGDNLRAHPEDLLRPPATVPIWDRYLHGHGKREELSSRQTDCVASYLALFSRFGYESPVDNEAVYIAKLIEQVDPSIGWARFQQIVMGLRKRRILQGSKTLFFVPKALHIYLWKHFWDQYGAAFRFTEVFSSMPESLHVWFMKMFKYAGNAAADHVVDEILAPSGMYADTNLLTSAKGSQFFSTLAEANPLAVLRLLEHTLGKWTDDQLLAFKEHRQNIVWAIEKIAVWPSLAVRAINLLACLARNENATNTNNATGTLLGLFRIGPEWAATEATPQQRFPAILQLLRSPAESDKRLALRAMEVALDMRALVMRIVGPEYQGIKGRAKLWIPPTYGDWWGAQFSYFSTLIDETSGWDTCLHEPVCATWLHAVEQQLRNPQSVDLAFETLEKLITDPLADSSKINHFFSHWLEYREKGQDDDIAPRLMKLQRKYAQQSLKSRFQRYVVDVDYIEWDTGYRERAGKRKNRSMSLVNALAKRVANDQNAFAEIEDLLAPQGSTFALWHFGEQLAKFDPGRSLLTPLLTLTLKSKHQVCLHAYLSALRSVDKSLAHQTVIDLLSNSDQAWLGATIALRSDFDDDLFERCLSAFENGWIEARQFSAVRWARDFESVPTHRITSLVAMLYRKRSREAVATLIELLDALPFNDDTPFTAELVFETVVAALPGNEENWHGVQTHDWEAVCKKLVAWDKGYAMRLLEKLLTKMGTDYRLTYDFAVSPLATELLRQDPASGWIVVAKQFEVTLPKWRSDLFSWLKGGLTSFNSEEKRHTPIAAIDVNTILNWISAEPELRAALIAHAAPRTLDDEFGGALTRALITQYGQIDGVLSGIRATFLSGGWSGPTSVYLRGRRDKFRTWLAAGYSFEVTQWVESEIEYLDRRIASEEIDEERSRFD
jgi:hypothetical protein